MTLQQKATYAPCREGWSRFNFALYLKVRSEKGIRLMKGIRAKANQLTEELSKPYARPTTPSL